MLVIVISVDGGRHAMGASADCGAVDAEAGGVVPSESLPVGSHCLLSHSIHELSIGALLGRRHHQGQSEQTHRSQGAGCLFGMFFVSFLSFLFFRFVSLFFLSFFVCFLSSLNVHVRVCNFSCVYSARAGNKACGRRGSGPSRKRCCKESIMDRGPLINEVAWVCVAFFNLYLKLKLIL